MSERNAESRPETRRRHPGPAWDPFQLMDRMDEEALRRELEGVAARPGVCRARRAARRSSGSQQDRRGRVLHGAGLAGTGDSRGGSAVRGSGRRRGAGGALQGQGGAVRRLPGRARTSASIRSSASSASRCTTSRPSSTSTPGCPARSTGAAPTASCCRPTTAATTSPGWRSTSARRRSATSCGAFWPARRSWRGAGVSSTRTGTRPAP